MAEERSCLSLRGMRRRSLQRAPWATRWYLAAGGFLGSGAVLGPLMAAEVAWTRGSLLGAHLVLTLDGGPAAALTGEHRVVVAAAAVGGWIGLTVLGSLLHLLALMTRVRGRLLPSPAPPHARVRDAAPAAVSVLAVDAIVAGMLLGATALTAAGALALAAIYVVVGARVLRSAVDAVRAAPLAV